MIKLKLLSGPHTGKEYSITSMADPGSFLHGIYLNEWFWEIDYSGATDKETVDWMRHDIALRSIRALKKGLTVKFQKNIYQSNPDDMAEIKKVALQLEDDMVNSGRMISIESDNNNGVVIGIGGFEEK